MSEQPKIHIDSDWKAQAQAEKQRLAEQEKARSAQQPGAGGGAAGAGAAASPQAGGIPKADFTTLLSTMATQALFAMGAIPDPQTGQRIAHLDLARHHIDLIGVLEEKTRGNLTEEEANLIASTLYELRSHYVNVASQATSIGSSRGGQGGQGGSASQGSPFAQG